MVSQPLPANLAHLSLADVEAAMAEQQLPPVDLWNPVQCGHSAMEIKRDGRWFHDGGEIKRPAMVRMFSSILRREADGSFVLVTPAERLTIDVEDTPFVAVELKVDGEGQAMTLAFRLNTGDAVVADGDHPIRMDHRSDGDVPLVLVRDGLEARIERAPFYELAEIALDSENQPPGVWSAGIFFPLGDTA